MCKEHRSYSSLILNLGTFNTRFREVSLLLTLCSLIEMLFHRRLSTSPPLITHMLILELCWIYLTPVFNNYVSTMEARCVDYLKSRLSLLFFSGRMVEFFLSQNQDHFVNYQLDHEVPKPILVFLAPCSFYLHHCRFPHLWVTDTDLLDLCSRAES